VFRVDLTRRQLLLGALSSAVAFNARAIGPGSYLRIGQLKYSGNWDARERATYVMARTIRQRTSIDVQLEKLVLEVEDKRLFQHPFAVMMGDRSFRFTQKERDRLKKWLEAGGLLLVDNTGWSTLSEPFDESLRQELSSMFPGRELERISPDHVLYRCFYLLSGPPGRAIHAPNMEALTLDGRLAVIYSKNDLMGALDENPLAGFSHDVHKGSRGREECYRMAVNLLMYAMCLDYKDDQVHQDFLKRNRRQFRARPPVIRPD
jgi:hypothetical protein